MKQEDFITKAFIPPDVLRIATRIEQTWTKLTDREITYYLEGRRDKLLAVLKRKYHFSSREQAEVILNSIERMA